MKILTTFSIFLTLLFSQIDASPIPYPRTISYYDGAEWAKSYSKHPLDLFDNLLTNTPTILEARAFFGGYSSLIAKKWPQATIFCFSPHPDFFEIFLSKTKNFENIQGYHFDINTFDGSEIFLLPFPNPYEKSLLPTTPRTYKKEAEVPCVNLDNWCASNFIDHVDLLWLNFDEPDFKVTQNPPNTLEVLVSSPNILKTVKIIRTSTKDYDMDKFNNLRDFLEKNSFTLLAHWHEMLLTNINQIYSGQAIFIKEEK